MEKEKYLVSNKTRGPVSFSVAANLTQAELEKLPTHKRRKLIRVSLNHVVIPYGATVDLIDLTGLSAAELAACPELLKLRAVNAVDVETVIEQVTEDVAPPAPRMVPVDATVDKGQEEDTEDDDEGEEEDTSKPKAKKRTRRAKARK